MEFLIQNLILNCCINIGWGVDEIHMQKAKCLARGIKSKNESNAKFIMEVIVRQRELLSESGSVHDNFLREGSTFSPLSFMR